MIEGILFDMDGVLVDSEEFICNAAIEMFKNLGFNVKPEDFEEFVGTGENRYIGGVAEKYGVKIDINKAKEETYSIYEKLVANKLKPLPGVFDFIKTAKNMGLKLAVATSADETKMLINLREMGINKDTFDATVNGLEVENKKPAPDIFLLAAKKLGTSPNKCLVVEDAISGVKAAKSAGAKCLALMSSFSKEQLADADWISNDLSDAPSESINW